MAITDRPIATFEELRKVALVLDQWIRQREAEKKGQTFPNTSQGTSSCNPDVMAAMDQPWLTWVMGWPTVRVFENSWTADVGQCRRFSLFPWVSRHRPKAEESIHYWLCIKSSEMHPVSRK